MGSTLLLSALFVLATASANVMQKKAMTGSLAVVSLDTLRRLAANPYLWGGLGCWAFSLSMYLVILSRVPLNVAASISTLNFVAVLLASRIVLGEPIPPLRVFGFACILLGMTIVAFTQRRGA